MDEWELIGLCNFVEPFRMTDNGEEIVSRFTARYGPVTLTGILLCRKKMTRSYEYRLIFAHSRSGRCFVNTQAAHTTLTRLAIEYRRAEMQISGPPHRSNSLISAPREGVSNGVGKAAAARSLP